MRNRIALALLALAALLAALGIVQARNASERGRSPFPDSMDLTARIFACAEPATERILEWCEDHGLREAPRDFDSLWEQAPTAEPEDAAEATEGRAISFQIHCGRAVTAGAGDVVLGRAFQASTRLWRRRARSNRLIWSTRLRRPGMGARDCIG